MVANYRGSKQLSSLVDSITRPVFERRGFLEGRLIMDWAFIAGEKLALYTLPQRIVFPDKETKTNGVLHLQVSNSAIAMELSYMEPVLLEKIAVYLGYKAIGRIKAHLKPQLLPVIEKEKRPLALSPEKSQLLTETVNQIDDPGLRDALYRLGKHILADSKTHWNI